jgi:hypothetical protein
VQKSDQRKKECIRGQDSADGGTVPTGLSLVHRNVISAFILVHLVAITLWAVPYDLSFIVRARDLIQPYMRWTGLFQTWNMFAPNPILKNTYIKAVVITEHHHIHTWDYPRMDQLGFGERYRKERYRKFAENLLEDRNSLLLADVVKHIARFYNDPDDPPEKVILLKYETEIRPWISNGNEPAPPPSVLYEDYIDPADLR